MSTKIKTKNHPIVHPHHTVFDGSELPNIVDAEGIYIKDDLGNVYIDAISGLWNVSLGYNHPKINEAIHTQVDHLSYANIGEYQTSATVGLASKVLELLPSSFSKVIYTSSGSESVELSIKLARQYHYLKHSNSKKKEFVVFENSYHGSYYGSMAASGTYREVSKMYEPVVPGFHFLKSPFKENETEVLKETLHFLEKNHETLAGFILEPTIGSGGIITLSKEYIHAIKNKCEQLDILLIFDEVATGFGRTGKMFAMDHYDIDPDIVCFSKGINSGYLPLAITVFNQKVTDVFEKAQAPINHLSTQNGNPVSCAAGLATLKELNEQGIVEDVAEKGEKFLRMLRERLARYPIVKEIRGQGFMIGIELSRSNQDVYPYPDLKKLIDQFKKKGLIVHGFYSKGLTSGISLFPSFITTDQELVKITKVLESIIKRNS